MEIKSKRYYFIDYAKAFGIILICIGHFLEHGLAVKTALYSFHVPVFFVIAGFLFKSDVESPARYINKTARRVLVPYCCWFLLSALRYLPSMSLTRIKALVLDFIMWDGLTLWNDPIWFIPVYFIAITAFCLLLYLLRQSCGKVRNFIVCTVAVLCFACEIICDIAGLRFVPLGFNKAIMMLGYICIGYLLRRVFELLECAEYQSKRKVLASVISLVVFACFFAAAAIINRGNNLSVLTCDFNNIFVYIPLSIVGSCSFIMMFLAQKHSDIIETISNSTIFIMGAHYFLLYIWRKVAPDRLPFDLIGSALTLIIMVALCLCFQRLYTSRWKHPTIPVQWLGFMPKKQKS